jgi:TolB-like protein/Tfp pilus assembly protein PilF
VFLRNEGETLDTRVRRDGPLPLSIALDVAEQVARALTAAEAHRLVHRDLKPSNIMVVANGAGAAEELAVKVIDFGLAKAAPATQDTSDQFHPGFSGTPGFASPEQLCTDNASLDTRSDIYSLGATLWYLVCGKTPFAGQSLRELREKQFHRPSPLEKLAAAKVPVPVRRLLRSMLATSPRERPSSARELLTELRRCRQMIEARPRRRKLTALAFLVISVVGLMSYLWPRHVQEQNSSIALITPEKSIAVLPFENLSNDREDAFFADGIQDDLLTKLAKIADLKVISRSSVMQYRGKRDMREVGDDLRVSHVLEGSVRKIGAWLHINAQLIDTRTDSHVWAEQYDRDLKEVFAVQSEIAQKVAKQLQAKISPAEKLAIERPPTADLTAFDLYSRAKNLLLIASYRTNRKEDLLRAADLLNQAVAHDPSFFQAYCQLASTHDLIYFTGFDRSLARLSAAEAATQAAFRLRPDAGEAHLASAETLYRGYLDYTGASAQLEIARKTLPNDPRVFELKGFIERRQGRWEESTQNLERAANLDPRNIVTLQQIGISYELLRRYAEARLVFDRLLTIEPNDLETRVERALIEFDWKADTRLLHEVIDSTRAADPAALPKAADAWLTCALAERDLATAAHALAALGDNRFGDEPVRFSPSFVEGLIARMAKDDSKAQSAFAAARTEQEKIVQTQPDYGPALCVLGLIDAGLGRKAEALREAQRAIELLPVEKDSINGGRMIECFAIIAAWVGDKDLACEQLLTAINHPSFLSYGHLKLLPFWDPLRGDPRFEKIVASLAPKEMANK